jgi:hypothetical protein
LASNLFVYLFSAMAVHFSALLAMSTPASESHKSVAPSTTHHWSPSTIACSPLLMLPLLHA